MRYESNPKHSEPWQRGRRGTQCPADLDQEHAERLLRTSEQAGRRRYAVLKGRAFCAQEHRRGVWHGYPVGWVQVPHDIRRKWVQLGMVRRHDIKRNWS